MADSGRLPSGDSTARSASRGSQRLSQKSLEFAKQQYSKKFRLPSTSDPIFAADRPSTARSSSTGRRRPMSGSSTVCSGDLDQSMASARGGGLAAVRGARPVTARGAAAASQPAPGSSGGGGSGYYPQPFCAMPFGAPYGMPSFLPGQHMGGMPLGAPDMAASYMWPGLFLPPSFAAAQAAAMYQMYPPPDGFAGYPSSVAAPPGAEPGGLSPRYVAPGAAAGAAAGQPPPVPAAAAAAAATPAEPSPVVLEFNLSGGELMELVTSVEETVPPGEPALEPAQQQPAPPPQEEPMPQEQQVLQASLPGESAAPSSSSAAQALSPAPHSLPSPRAATPRLASPPAASPARPSPSLRPEVLAASSTGSPFLSPTKSRSSSPALAPASGAPRQTPRQSAAVLGSGGGGSGGARRGASGASSTPRQRSGSPPSGMPTPLGHHATATTSSTVLGASASASTAAASAAQPLAENLLNTLSRSISEAVALGLEHAPHGTRSAAPGTYNINITLSIPTALAAEPSQTPHAHSMPPSPRQPPPLPSPATQEHAKAEAPLPSQSPAPPQRLPVPKDLRTVAAVADWEAAESLRLSMGLVNAAAELPPPSQAHAYPLWFLLALTRSACEEIESAGTRTLSASAAAASMGMPAPSSASAPYFTSPVRATLSPSAPLPSPSAWTVNHSASLQSAWLWCLQAARDLRMSALVARSWLQSKSSRGSGTGNASSSGWGGGSGSDSGSGSGSGSGVGGPADALLSPTFPSTLDPVANRMAALEAGRSGSPFGGLVQEDHILRLLRRLPTGHLPRATAIATKALLVRVLLAVAGWGCLNDATATIMKLHIEEAVADTKVAAAAAQRRGSHFGEVPTPLGEEGGAGGEAGGSSKDAATLSPLQAVDLVEAVLLEPLSVLPPASLSSFSQYGVDGLGGALGGAGARFEVNYLITPDAVRDAMREVAEGGKAGAAHPGAASDYLLSPSADLYPYASGPFSPGLAPPLDYAPGPGMASPAPPSALNHPGHYSFFGPAAWECLAYARKRTPGHANLATVLATPKEALKAHFEFVEMCLKGTVAPPLLPAPGSGGALPFTSPLTPGPASAAAAEGSEAAAASGVTLFLSPDKEPRASSAALDAEAPAAQTPAASAASSSALAWAEYTEKANAAVGAEIASVVGRSLLRDAQDRLLRNAAGALGLGAPSGEGAGAGAAALLSGGVRFMLVMLTPDGKALMEEAGTGAPLLLRTVVPMLDVELALGALSRSGRRHLGHAEAAAVQSGETASSAVVEGIAASLSVSPLKNK